MYFPKKLSVKRIHMRIPISIQSSDRKVVALHFRSDCKVALRVLLNVSEVAHRSTTRRKEGLITCHITAHQCDDFPFLVIKSHRPDVKAGTYGRLTTSIPCYSTFNINDFCGAHILCKSLHTLQMSDADFSKNGHSHLNRIKSWLSLSTGSYLPDQWKSNVCIWGVWACSCIATTSHGYGTLANSTTTTNRNQRKQNKTRKNNKEEREGDRPATHDRRGNSQQGSTPSSTLPKGPRQPELMRAGHASSSDQCQQYHEAKLVQCFGQVP